MTDIEIAQANVMEPISKVAEGIGIGEADLDFYGKYKAKITYSKLNEYLEKVSKPSGRGHLILVTAMTPTAAL